MRDEQWKLEYPASGRFPGAAFTFGTQDTGYLTLKRPAFDFADDRTDDQEMVTEDGVRFGRDFTGGMTITFDVGVDTSQTTSSKTMTPQARTAANLDAVDRLRAAWSAKALKRRPGAVAVLREAYGGRERVFYGRPRGFAVPQVEGHPRDRLGYTAVLARFDCVDQNYYDGVEQSIDVPIAPAASGGLVAPLKSPLRAVRPNSSTRVLSVGGTSPAVPVITLYGPGSNLTVEFVGVFSVGIRATLAYDQRVTIDPRPFARTVLNQAGASWAGRLTGVARLSDMLIPPGQRQVIIRGTDTTGTAKANIRWRNTYAYL